MIWLVTMFNKYFELASNNNTGESLAFVVTVVTSSVANIIFVTEITFKVHVIVSSVVTITFVETEITFLSG